MSIRVFANHSFGRGNRVCSWIDRTLIVAVAVLWLGKLVEFEIKESASQRGQPFRYVIVLDVPVFFSVAVILIFAAKRLVRRLRGSA